jgi:hypothetical protein
MTDDQHHYRAPEPPPPEMIPLVQIQRADNGDLILIINHSASAVDVMLSILRAMGAS